LATPNNPLTNDSPMVEIADVNTGNPIRTANTIEGPISTQTGTARVNVGGRMMAVDPTGTTAYLLTTSGLSVVPLDPLAAADRPQVTANGIVNLANFSTSVAPGSLVAINGRNLAGSDSADVKSTLPTLLGGSCITLNNRPLPLIMSSANQVNA